MKINTDLLYTFINKNIKESTILKNLNLLGFEATYINKCFDIDIPYNRQDCNNLISILNELSKINLKIQFKKENILNKFNIKNIKIDKLKIHIYENKFCPLYTCIKIFDLKIKKKIPSIIKDFLILNGITSVNSLIDIINYATLITGQPLHAYDLNKIGNDIYIKKNEEHRDFFSINNEKSIINKNDHIIFSDGKIISIPGILGSFESKVIENTTNILLESAFFNFNFLNYTYNYNTDSYKRFLYGINKNNVEFSLMFTIKLIFEYLEGSPFKILKKVYSNNLPKSKIIKIKKNNIFDIIGYKINNYYLNFCLKRINIISLNFKYNIFFYINNYRNDLKSEESLISEIIKIFNYEKILNIFINKRSIFLTAKDTKKNNIRDLLRNNNFNEIITYSFVDNNITKLFKNNKKNVFIRNPLSEKNNVMRNDLFYGLINSIKLNLNRQNYDIKLFELGNIYFYDKNNNIKIQNKLGIMLGNNENSFYFLKKIIEQIITIFFKKKNFSFIKSQYKFFNKEINSRIIIDNIIYGYVGLINKNILDYFSIKTDLYYLSFNISSLSLLNANDELFFENFSKFPKSIKDLSLILDNSILYIDVLKFILNMKIDNLLDINFLDLFDIKVKNKKSLTLRFVFQDMNKTLKEDDIKKYMTYIQIELEKHFSAEIRLT